MKQGNSRGSSNTKEESVAADQSRVTPPRRLGRDAAGAVPARDNPAADRMSPAKTTEGEGGGGTVVTVNGCPPKNSSVIYLTSESSPANRSANTGKRLSRIVYLNFPFVTGKKLQLLPDLKLFVFFYILP
jgi:hypothetical protein